MTGASSASGAAGTSSPASASSLPSAPTGRPWLGLDGEQIAHLGQYALVRTLVALVHAFSPEQNLRTASAVGRFFHRISPRRAGRADEHIAMALPHATPERRAAIAEASMENMFRIFMVESMLMPQLLNQHSCPRFISFGSLGQSLDLMLSERPAILVTGHCGNWELLGLVLAMLDFPVTALARPLDNPYLDRWLMRMRESRGLRVLTKWGATEQIQAIIESGGRIGFIADQNAGDDGIFVPFFGRLASAYKSIGLLAMRYRIPVVVGAAIREDHGMRYRLETVDLFEPESWESQPDPLFYITARYTRGIETAVRMAPEQYLWIHRRWKSRPRFERENRPFPAAMREKLRSLPWMSEADVESVERASQVRSPA